MLMTTYKFLGWMLSARLMDEKIDTSEKCWIGIEENAILTKLRMLSTYNVHVFTFEKAANAKLVTTKKIRRLQEKGKHTGNGNLEANAYYANFNFAKKYGCNDEKVEIADAYQARSDPVNPGRLRGRNARQLNSVQLLVSLTHGTLILTQKLARSW